MSTTRTWKGVRKKRQKSSKVNSNRSFPPFSRSWSFVALFLLLCSVIVGWHAVAVIVGSIITLSMDKVEWLICARWLLVWANLNSFFVYMQRIYLVFFYIFIHFFLETLQMCRKLTSEEDREKTTVKFIENFVLSRNNTFPRHYTYFRWWGNSTSHLML